MLSTQKIKNTPQEQITISDVIGMFRRLDLPVTDDGGQIEAKGNELQQFYLRKKGSPDPQERNKANTWFKDLTRLKTQRDGLLDTVSKYYTQLADTALEVALESGVKTLTPEIHTQLERFALDQCNCDHSLSKRLVNEYLQKKGITVHDALVSPWLVENLAAFSSSTGQVKLTWKFPPEDCDEVLVKRFELPGDGQTGKEICRGKLNAYIDQNVKAGQQYRYEVYSFWRQVCSQTCVAMETVAVGEVSDVKNRWVKDHVELSWQKPSVKSEIFIFRAPSPIKPIQRGTSEPLPDNPEAKLVFRGTGSEWHDRDVTTGEKYHYLLVASFASGYFSDGVAVSMRTPVPPPAVTFVKAEYSEGMVNILWDPVSNGQQVDYTVVRRQGSMPSREISDGRTIKTTKQTSCNDREITPGYRYTYTVFTSMEGTCSHKGTAAPPVDILSEVTGLNARTGNCTVELYWQSPANISRIVVRRSMSRLEDHNDGIPVNLTGAGSAKDQELLNGRCYHYLVCCAYRPDSVSEIFSRGIRIQAVPDRLPEPVTNFTVQVENQKIICTWTSPDYGQAVVIRSARPPVLPSIQELTLEELDSLGERITTETDRAQDSHPDITLPYYSVFTVAGSYAVAGGTGSAVVYPDVTDLKLSATRDGIILRWSWPAGCTSVRVTRRLDAWPEGPDDPNASCVSYTRTEYRDAGEKFLDMIQQGSWRFYYIVYAQASGVSGQFFASGSEPGCKAVIQWDPWMTLQYRLISHVRNKKICLTWTIEKPFPNFAGFVLMANQTGPPSSLNDGVEIFRWTPDGNMEGKHEAWISLAFMKERRWARFFYKAIVIDPAQLHTTLIIHPNTCISVSDKHEMRIMHDNTKGVYRSGVPKTVICPYCFEEFPLKQMLFDSFVGGEPMTARYSWLARLLRRPLQPPVNKQGQRLIRKLCPNHRHILPFTAGTQSSMVIGVIGAKFSGKSHYIAALIDRLKGQVAADMQANLIPVTDETYERYQREFYDPLFEKGLELPVTVGAPSPLIYDLCIDGGLWGEKHDRAVTLALYDTAGENFDNPDTVRQMVQYLRIASGIIFLIDPLQSPWVREALPSSVPLPDVDRMAEPHVIIDRVLSELEHNKIMSKSGPLSTPVAVVLTKCDVLGDAGLIASNRLWNSDKRHIGFFDTEIHDDMTGMMGEYMMRWNLKAYNTVRIRFSRHAFFGVSSTGCASDKNTRRFKYVSPWRVEDPLLWLLTELGSIPVQ